MADMKFGYGNVNNIDTAVESGTLDERDLVLTKDTSELIYIKDDKTQQKIRSRVRTFTSTEDAVTELNKSSDTYAGQPISIKNSVDGKYYPYTVQQGASSFVIEPVISNTGSGFTWTEF
jgi:hypothetical protein